jgi:hypothetical protein
VKISAKASAEKKKKTDEKLALITKALQLLPLGKLRGFDFACKLVGKFQS